MTAFNVNDRVLVRPDAKFSFNTVERAFQAADYHGVVTDANDTADYGFYGYHLATIKVATPDGRQWDKFSADELERVEVDA